MATVLKPICWWNAEQMREAHPHIIERTGRESAWMPLSRGGLQRRAVKHHVFKLQPRTLPHQAEDVPALGAFVLQHVVPVLDRLDTDQGSFEVAGHADRCRRHVRRLFPVMVVGCQKLYRGRFAWRVNLPNRTNTGRMNTGQAPVIALWWKSKRAG